MNNSAICNASPISFAGITSLTNVLSELPLPKPLPSRFGTNQTLLFHPRIADEAQRLLDCTDSALANSLASFLSEVNCDHVIIKDEFCPKDGVFGGISSTNQFDDENATTPNLLKVLLNEHPNVFGQSNRNNLKTEQHQQQLVNTSNSIIVKEPVPPLISAAQQQIEPKQEQDEVCQTKIEDDQSIPQQYRHMFSNKAVIRLEQLPENQTRKFFTHSASHRRTSSEKRSSLSISMGKQPKAQPSSNRRKKDMVSELFDSLTPSAEYFGDKSRRRTATHRLYTDEKTPGHGSSHHHDDDGHKSDFEYYAGSDLSPCSSAYTKDEDDDGSLKHSPVRDVNEDKEWREVLKKRKEKYKRRSAKTTFIDPKELVENESYRRFLSSVDSVFDNVEECDTLGDDEEIPSECLLPKSLLAVLCSESNKLRAMGVLNRVPIERLSKLITILERNVKDGSSLSLGFDDKSDEEASWRDLVSDRVFRSLDAALIALTVMTGNAMPRQVYLEDAIERSAQLVKFQLMNTIAPAFDPTYRVVKDTNENEMNPKAKRFKGGGGHHHQVQGHKNKTILAVYARLIELVGCFADLITLQALPDTTVLHLCTLGVNSFFIDHLSELQLNSLRLLANIFNRYENYRKMILEEILISLARSSTTKKTHKNYKLSSNDSIQMVSALVMQLVQAAVHVPSSSRKRTPDDIGDDDEDGGHVTTRPQDAAQSSLDVDHMTLTSYDRAQAAAHTFLGAFLNKCRTKNEDDYRPLFEAFINDLLLALHKPEWPAAELFLNLLGKLLVQSFSNKQTDVTLRVASLEYLGVVAARLRKDMVACQLDEHQLESIVENLRRENLENKTANEEDFQENNKIQILQRGLVDYLVELKENDLIIEFSRQYFVAQWYKDLIIDQERGAKAPSTTASAAKSSSSSKKKHKQRKKRHSSSSSDDDDDDDVTDDQSENDDVIEKKFHSSSGGHRTMAADNESQKQFVLSLVDRNIEEFYGSKLHRRAPVLNDSQAAFVVRWLANKRPLSQSFDIYLAQILRVLNETVVAIRTKAMKCLSTVVEVDPSMLARPDVQRGVHCRLLDTSSSVREVAIDLIGKFVTAKPELIDQYYQMLIDRILDTGVSVRKRVIKILKDIYEKRPDFEKIPEICVRILRRMNDEEGVRKLVCESFHTLWFIPSRDRESSVKLLKKVLVITDAVGACAREGGQYEGFEALLHHLLVKEGGDRFAHSAAKQIVNCLVENVLTLDEKLADNDRDRAANHQRMLYCLTTLYLFAKVKPTLMVEHAQTMQPYLSMNCNTQGEQAVLIQVIKILEMVVPLMDHPGEAFLSQVEDILLKLAGKSGQNVVQASISCLGAIINRLSKNWQKVSLLFQKYLGALLKLKGDYEISGSSKSLVESKPSLLRSLFTIGLLCQHFDFDAHDRNPTEATWNDQAYTALSYFLKVDDEDVKLKAFGSVGFFCIQHPTYMIREDTKKIYLDLFIDPHADVKLKTQVLRNIESFLREEEAKMAKSYDEWDRSKQKENLKEMGETASGQGSSIIQHFLREILECYFHRLQAVRGSVCNVTMLTLQQGLVHPVQCIPYVIAMGTDSDVTIRNKSDNILKEIDSKYSGFVQMKACEGVKLSFRLQKLLTDSAPAPSTSTNNRSVQIKPPPLHAQSGDQAQQQQLTMTLCLKIPIERISLARGLRIVQEQPQALNSFVYSLLRSVRQQRRGFLKSLLQSFDDTPNVCLEELIYIADNLASFAYQTLDEPLFVIHSIDLTVSVTGASLLHSFEEALIPRNKSEADEDGDTSYEVEDQEDLLARLPENLTTLEDYITASRGCVLLLVLKQYLKDIYGFNDSKIQEYSPSEPAKTYEKALNRRSWQTFQPKYVFEYLQSTKKSRVMDRQEQKRVLCQRYMDFKQLIMSIDTASANEENDTNAVAN